MKSRKIPARVVIAGLLVSLLLPALAAADRDDDGYPRLMQGPMVGAVTPTQVKIWTRTTGPYAVSIEYAINFEMRSATTSESRAICSRWPSWERSNWPRCSCSAPASGSAADTRECGLRASPSHPTRRTISRFPRAS